MNIFMMEYMNNNDEYNIYIYIYEYMHISYIYIGYIIYNYHRGLMRNIFINIAILKYQDW